MDAIERMNLEIQVASRLHAGILANPKTEFLQGQLAARVIQDHGSGYSEWAYQVALSEARRLIAHWNPPIKGNEDKR